MLGSKLPFGSTAVYLQPMSTDFSCFLLVELETMLNQQEEKTHTVIIVRIICIHLSHTRQNLLTINRQNQS